MRKPLVALCVLLVAGLTAAIAIAQTPAPVVTSDVSISPSNSGSKSKPTAASFKFTAVNSAASQTTVSDIRLDMPTGVKLDGTRLQTCTIATLTARGPTACPSGSKLGKGVAYAFLVDKSKPAPDCVGTRGRAAGCLTFDNEFFVGGKRLLSVWLSQRGGSVRKALQGDITRSGRRLDIEIPRDLQVPVRNAQDPSKSIYSALLQLEGTFKRSRKVGGKTYSFVSTTACGSGGRWAVKTTFTYVPNPQQPQFKTRSSEDRTRCTK